MIYFHLQGETEENDFLNKKMYKLKTLEMSDKIYDYQARLNNFDGSLLLYSDKLYKQNNASLEDFIKFIRSRY